MTPIQPPIPSGFGPATTAEELIRGISLADRIAIVTGGNSGLGRETARLLHEAGVLDAQGHPIIDPARNLKTIGQGAATIVWCAVSPRLNGKGGVYGENCDIAAVSSFAGDDTKMQDTMRISGVMPYAVDPSSAERLWTLSEKMINQ